MLSTLFFFFLALLLLIMVHEYGHFLVARWCGVKVLRFSFGFGKVLASWRSKKGTEFSWSLFPLGGYVKMLDETEGEVPEEERHMAFNNKSVWARMAIVAAGPLFNFLFAFVALWLVLVIGIKSLAPMIDKVEPDSIAAQAGLQANQEILAINNKKIVSWRDFQYALMPLLGTNDPLEITVKSLDTGHEKKIMLPMHQWKLSAKNPDLLESFGIIPFIPTIPPVVGEVITNSPAEQAGLHAGDKIAAVNGKVITDWLMLVEFVREHPNEPLSLTVKRQQETRMIPLHTGSIEQKGKKEGFIGVRSQRVEWPGDWLRIQRLPPLEALNSAFSKTIHLTGTTFTLIGRLFLGKLPLESISGPVGIAKGAGESARSGFTYYLSFLALVSISLGVLNLLPIPLLDGGHLLYCIIELIRRRPLSDEMKLVGVYLGLGLLVILTVVALKNDLVRMAG